MRNRGSGDTVIIVVIIVISLGLFIFFGLTGWIKDTKDKRHGLGDYSNIEKSTLEEKPHVRPQPSGYSVKLDL